MNPGALRERVAFGIEVLTDGPGGSKVREFVEGQPVAAEFRYQKGAEAVDAGGLTGRAVFKVRVRSSSATRGITADHQMRDVRRGTIYNVREVDAITDRMSVWLMVERGVAV